MDGAFGRDRDVGEPSDQALSDLTSAPAGVLALHVEDVVLYLKGKLVGIAKGTSAPVGESLYSALLVAIEDLVAGFAGEHWVRRAVGRVMAISTVEATSLPLPAARPQG